MVTISDTSSNLLLSHKEIQSVVDQMGREVSVAFPPARIVSLVPSITEFLLDIGAPVVGRTKFCIHPADQARDIPVIGGTKKFKLDRIRALSPDLIVGNKEENYREGIDALAEAYPVWMSEIYTLEDAYKMMHSLGKLTGREESSNALMEKVQKKTHLLRQSHAGKAIYLIWKNPWMAVGRNTYVNSFLECIGYENCIQQNRYPQLTDEEIRALKPEVILLSSEPYPFREKDMVELQSKYPDADVKLVDGEMYSWYGSRIAHLE